MTSRITHNLRVFRDRIHTLWQIVYIFCLLLLRVLVVAVDIALAVTKDLGILGFVLYLI